MFDATTGPTGREMLVARNVAEHLCKKFPDHPWCVRVDRGLVHIHCGNLSQNMGYTLHEDKIDFDYKAVTLAGGEILERFNMPTGRYDDDRHLNLKRLHGLPAFER